MSIKDKDDIIFEDKSLSDIFADIYNNSKKRKGDIDTVMKSFMTKIKHNKDVTFIGPVIKDLLHVSVQNDEQLVKMATVIQRIMTSNNKDEDGDYDLSDDMKEQLLKIAKESNKSLDASITDDFSDIEDVMLGDAEPEIMKVKDDIKDDDD